MKTNILFILLLIGSMLRAQTPFKHTATTTTINDNWTVIDNPATNNNPNALLQVTADFGASGPYHTKPVGVWYTNNKWTIFNQDRTPMTVNAKFNILVVAPSNNGFMHTSTQIAGHITYINHPSLNNNPNAKFLATQNWGNTGPYNNNPIGVYYVNGKWAIYNQNYAPMPPNAKFNIMVNQAIFIVTANAPTGNYFFFDNPATTNYPNAFVFATQYWTSVYNPNEIGVWYSGNKWSVYNQNRNPLPVNAKFMVYALNGSSNPYDNATISTIQQWAGQMNNAKINGSNNSFNQLTVNRLVFYKTNEGRFGKMEIQEYGYNLKIRYTTYNANGSVKALGNQWLIKGTFLYDLDNGREVNDATSDFWWEQETHVIRFLTPKGGATFMVAN